jgi:hypothetical protein
MGFSFVAMKPNFLGDLQLPGTLLPWSSGDRRASNFMEGTVSGMRTAIFDSFYDASVHQYTRNTIAVFASTQRRLPTFDLSRKLLLQPYVNLVQLAAPEFSKHFILPGSDHVGLRRVFDQQVIDLIISTNAREKLQFSGGGPWLVFLALDRELKLKKWRGFLQDTSQIAIALFEHAAVADTAATQPSLIRTSDKVILPPPPKPTRPTVVISTPVVIKALKIGGSVFLFFGLMFVAVGGWKGYREYCILKYWPSVDATVTRCQADHYRVYSSSSKSWNWRNRLILEFRYSVAGREYITVPPFNEYATPDLLQSKADEYAEGTHHALRYNPKNPEDIKYDVSLNFNLVAYPIFSAAPAILFFVIAYGFLALIRWMRSLVCPTCGQNLVPGQASCPHCGALVPAHKAREP